MKFNIKTIQADVKNKSIIIEIDSHNIFKFYFNDYHARIFRADSLDMISEKSLEKTRIELLVELKKLESLKLLDTLKYKDHVFSFGNEQMFLTKFNQGNIRFNTEFGSLTYQDIKELSEKTYNFLDACSAILEENIFIDKEATK